MAAPSYGLCGNDKKAAEAAASLRALVPQVTASGFERTMPYVLAEDRARIGIGRRQIRHHSAAETILVNAASLHAAYAGGEGSKMAEDQR